MDLFDSIRNKMNEAREEMREREAHIKDMSRGFDVLQSKHKGKCSGKMALRRLFPLIVSTAFVAAAYFAYDYAKQYPALKCLAIAFAVLVGYYELRNLILLLRLAFGFYDIYGGYVLDKHVEQKLESKYRGSESLRRKRLRENNESIHGGYHTVYHANINGVLCRISKSQYTFLKLDEYYYVIRIKRRYIVNDEFFFIKADRALENERTGNHFPKDENRKSEPSGIGCIGTCSIVFGAVALLAGLLTGLVAKQPDALDFFKKFSFAGTAVGCGLILFGIIFGKLRK